MVILEGPDGGGKSTLGKELSVKYKIPLIHTGGPINSKTELKERLEDLEITRRPNVIFDRIPLISELVYPVIQGREPFISFDDSADLLEAIGGTIFYCRSSSVELMKQNMLRGKQHKPEEFIDAIQRDYPLIVDRYDEVFDQLGKRNLRIRRYDWKDHR